ncbi:hypothetical protein QFW80_04570 [Luteimonas sp. M1R5S18]|uniref:Uncharacterized protein n=1 Tax=Luteimonas rhizosphaericola TaxID=3042024 RepID=A0ABT6JGH7_9GAMM|nr:hypothetical protein [Luteimonas rhizosphaericola]MDH5829792.1 hypothetical protein [Luteimonas rhizosphaericola]
MLPQLMADPSIHYILAHAENFRLACRVLRSSNGEIGLIPLPDRPLPPEELLMHISLDRGRRAA